MDPTSVVTTIGVGLIIATVMMAIKVYIEAWLKPGDPRHDPTIQMIAGLIGVVGYVVHAWTLGPLTGAVFWDAAGQGFLSGLTSIFAYHVLTGSAPTMLPGNNAATPAPTSLVPATSTHVDVVTPTPLADQPVPPGSAA